MELTILFCLLASIAAFFQAPRVHGDVSADTMKWQDTPNPNQALLGNMSYLFGWQIAGAALSKAHLQDLCNNTVFLGHRKWDQIGLSSAYVSAPICAMSRSHTPNPQAAIPRIMQYNTEIFATQLLGSFNNTEALEYVCNNLGFQQVDDFMLIEQPLIASVCHTAGMQSPPEAEGPAHPPRVNHNAIFAANASASTTFGLLLAFGATSELEVRQYCSDARYQAGNYNDELLDGKAISGAICSLEKPIPVDEGLNVLVTWTTRTFITIVENISDGEGWLKWLCENVDVQKMNGVGLDGEAVFQQICSDSGLSS